MIYTLWRLGLFIVAFLALSRLGLGSWLLAIIAVVVAAMVSYAFLGNQRDAAALYLANRRTQAVNRITTDEDADFEDASIAELGAAAETPSALSQD